MPWRLILSGWVLSMRVAASCIVIGFWDTGTCSIGFRIWRTVGCFVFANATITFPNLFPTIFWLGPQRFSWMRSHCHKSGLTIHTNFNLIWIFWIMDDYYLFFDWFFSLHRSCSIGGKLLWIVLGWSRGDCCILICNQWIRDVNIS